MQFLTEFHSTFKRISLNFQETLTQFLGEFYTVLK